MCFFDIFVKYIKNIVHFTAVIIATSVKFIHDA